MKLWPNWFQPPARTPDPGITHWNRAVQQAKGSHHPTGAGQGGQEGREWLGEAERNSCLPVASPINMLRSPRSDLRACEKFTSKPWQGGNGKRWREMSHQCLALPELLHFKLGSSRLQGGKGGHIERILLLLGSGSGQPWDGPALREPGRGSRAPPRLEMCCHQGMRRLRRDRNFPFGHFCNCW